MSPLQEQQSVGLGLLHTEINHQNHNKSFNKSDLFGLQQDEWRMKEQKNPYHLTVSRTSMQTWWRPCADLHSRSAVLNGWCLCSRSAERLPTSAAAATLPPAEIIGICGDDVAKPYRARRLPHARLLSQRPRPATKPNRAAITMPSRDAIRETTCRDNPMKKRGGCVSWDKT